MTGPRAQPCTCHARIAIPYLSTQHSDRSKLSAGSKLLPTTSTGREAAIIHFSNTAFSRRAAKIHSSSCLPSQQVSIMATCTFIRWHAIHIGWLFGHATLNHVRPKFMETTHAATHMCLSSHLLISRQLHPHLIHIQHARAHTFIRARHSAASSGQPSLLFSLA